MVQNYRGLVHYTIQTIRSLQFITVFGFSLNQCTPHQNHFTCAPIIFTQLHLEKASQDSPSTNSVGGPAEGTVTSRRETCL